MWHAMGLKRSLLRDDGAGQNQMHTAQNIHRNRSRRDARLAPNAYGQTPQQPQMHLGIERRY